ncbi:MAG: TonB-dependent receptor [Gammaproteobacteria bacterium]|nr:TonB-dependent receptor [Gammaproteobacteria bacterium]
MRKSFSHLTQAIILTAATIAGVPAIAGALDEVVVTARRVEESLQETPISVTALSADDMELRSIANVRDVVPYVPNLSAPAGYNGGGDGYYYIRGVGQNDFSTAFDPGVGVYVDGIYLGRTSGATFELLDTERIEVLRGPQGTLFGRNTIGGAINVVSARPADEFGATAEMKFGERDLWQVKGSVEGPLADTVNGKISMLYKEQDGWGKRLVDGQTLGDIEDFGAHGMLDMQVSEQLSIAITGDYTRGRGTAALQTTPGADMTGLSPFFIPVPQGDVGAGIPDINADISPSRFRTWADADTVNDLDVWGLSLVVDRDFGAANLKSITGYRNLEQTSGADYDVTRFATYNDIIPIDQDQFSQEFQLSGLAFDDRLKWLAGIYYYNEDVDQTNAINLGATGPGGWIAGGVPGGPIPAVVDAPLPLDRGQIVTSKQNILPEITSWALFGQATYKITERLSGTFGLRYTDEEKEQTYKFMLFNSIPGFAPFGFPFPMGEFPAFPETTVKKSWDSTDIRAGLEFQVREDILLYTSYAEGFRSGGFNSRPVTDQIDSFNPENLWTVEAGIKSELWDGRARVNLAAFYTEYDDIQLNVIEGGFFNIKNAGNAEMSGIELEVTARVTDAFDVNASLGYLDNELKDVDPNAAAFGITNANELPMAPDLTFNLGGQYTWNLGNRGSLTARADYAYQDESWSFVDNEPGNLMPSSNVVNLRLAWNSSDDRYTVAVYGLNVTDDKYLTFAQDVRQQAGTPGFGTYILWPAAPSEWGGELIVRF